MKRFLFLLVFGFYLLVSVAVAFALPVGKERAAKVAQHAVVRFNAELHGITPGAPVELTDVSQELGFNLIHLFNYHYAGVVGFVIVSGDDCTDPILAFSDFGELNLGEQGEGSGMEAKTNSAFLQHLHHYCAGIGAARESKATAPAHVAAKWQKLEQEQVLPKGDIYHDNIHMLLGGMTWGQSSPYNAKCPGRCVTGCVATAFGMIMNYWNYPEHGFGTHSYNGADNPAAYPDWSYGTLSADFEQTYYDWDHTPDWVNINSDTNEINAVATLLYQIGVSLDMNYGVNGSGCWSLPEYAIFDTSLHLSPDMGADTRIPKHFGYRYDYAGMRDSIGDDTLWMQMLYQSLVERKPIYYAGWKKDNSPAGHSATSGHGYVIDGYFSDEVDSNYFWINWGWNGTANGYFKLDAMKPQGSDFTQWHGAIIGLEPDTSYHGYNYLGVAETRLPEVSVSGIEGALVVRGAEASHVAVYDVMGRCVAENNRVATDRWQVSLPRGLYLVRVDTVPAQKAMVY